VDIRRPKKGGGYEACGRNDTTKGKKPVCVPSNKAKNLDKKEIKTEKDKKLAKKGSQIQARNPTPLNTQNRLVVNLMFKFK